MGRTSRAALVQWLVIGLVLLLFGLAVYIAVHRMDHGAPGRLVDAVSVVTE